jgi:hypothetical protein
VRTLPLTLVLAACGAAAPEVWLDLSPVDVGVHSPGGEPHPFSLQVGNRGGEDLTIQRVALYHDPRCAMDLEGPDRWVLSTGHEALFRGVYTPPDEPGEDVAVLAVDTNDPELPRLLVPICGAAEGEEPLELAECALPEPEVPDCPDREPILGEAPAE